MPPHGFETTFGKTCRLKKGRQGSKSVDESGVSGNRWMYLRRAAAPAQGQEYRVLK